MYGCMSMCSCVGGYVHLWLCICMGIPADNLRYCSLVSLNSLESASIGEAGWTGSSEISLPYFSSIPQESTTMPGVLHELFVSNSDPWVHKASTLPTELSSKPSKLLSNRGILYLKLWFLIDMYLSLSSSYFYIFWYLYYLLVCFTIFPWYW